ncbi:hypothetical protein TrVE_jg5190 [Triparma verrucosa]|uniref:Uncharacterized protein n=1 Tax=Triparma verrucosa TaxID=1606542 RepID=A0A9W7BCU7_9STRA|nr:hypothetical protein TrVE_jg5190 [Triparma verrucosa]
MPRRTDKIKLATGSSGVILSGKPYVLKKFNGRGHQVRLGSIGKGQDFILDGNIEDNGGIALRLASDPDLSLEVNYRKYEQGSEMSLWSVSGHPEYAVRFRYYGDSTIGPLENEELRIGRAASDGGKMVLVSRNSSKKVIWKQNDEMKRVSGRLREEDEKRREKDAILPAVAASLVTPEMLSEFKRDGFVKLSKVVDEELIESALREINREMGQATGSNDQFKAKTFAKEAAITDLFNQSSIPYVMELLLGPKVGGGKYSQPGGQLALRFPGDACVGKTAQSNAQHFEHIARGWHIDGCAGDFIKGVTDHYGNINNFDCLVGVCLSETKRPCSGELCTWPGSHMKLADYFHQGSNFDDVLNQGNSALPTKDTDNLFRGIKPNHCLAEPGDVFLANYMTAHFIAPNSSPHIRYAVYFRVHGPEFHGRMGGAHESMLDPWCHWPCMNDGVKRAEGKAEGDEEKHDFAAADFNLDDHHAAMDNAFLTPKVDGWACPECTYLHTTPQEIKMLACSMCGTERR